MDRSLQFLLAQQKVDLEAQLLEKQLITEGLNQAQIEQQTLNLAAQEDQIKSQTVQIEQQTANLTAEALNIPKQGALLDAQAAVQEQQLQNLQAEKTQTEAQTGLIEQQTANAITENTVLVAQECKLRGEYDILMEQKLKLVSETALLNQKKVTEQAQTSGVGVDADSVVGKQKSLYDAQANGFKRDAEQKTAKIMIDTWNVRQTTDGGQTVDGNGLNDAAIKRAVDAMLNGVNA